MFEAYKFSKIVFGLFLLAALSCGKNKNTPITTQLWKYNSEITTADFDNDGYSDFFLYRFGGLIQRVEDVIFKNYGNLNFESIATHGANHIPAKVHGDMGVAFDYNLDG